MSITEQVGGTEISEQAGTADEATAAETGEDRDEATETGEDRDEATETGEDRDEVVEAAGHFRIYLGAAAGVGKTYAMLDEGHRRRDRGADVVIGFVETHDRPLTESLVRGLEAIPRTILDYRGCVMAEMDTAAVLRRRPKIALIDELAHTNVPGSGPHEKRWQDVLDILAAGIDVITTVNIQHLESIADDVEQMTGAPVRERVPDWVVRKANQTELVDSSPEQLRRRMLHGNIYPPDRVEQALTHFFRTDNLIALRELALRFVADETEEELLKHLRRHRAAGMWETTERIMVAVTGAADDDLLVRRAARIAARVRADIDVLHVVGTDGSSADRGSTGKLQQLAADVGGRWHEVEDDDPARAIAQFAGQHRITQIVIRASRRSRWRQFTGGGSNVARIIKAAGDTGIDVHVVARREPDANGGGGSRPGG